MAIASKGISMSELADIEDLILQHDMCPVSTANRLVREIVRLREAIKSHNKSLSTSPHLVDKRLWEALDK